MKKSMLIIILLITVFAVDSMAQGCNTCRRHNRNYTTRYDNSCSPRNGYRYKRYYGYYRPRQRSTIVVNIGGGSRYYNRYYRGGRRIGNTPWGWSSGYRTGNWDTRYRRPVPAWRGNGCRR